MDEYLEDDGERLRARPRPTVRIPVRTPIISNFGQRFIQAVKKLANGSAKRPTTENAPPGRRGASGVTTGRRDMYLYICGSVGGRWALYVPRAPSWEATGAICAAPRPSQEVLFAPSSVPLIESLNSIRTYVRFVCECDHRLPSGWSSRLAEAMFYPMLRPS